MVHAYKVMLFLSVFPALTRSQYSTDTFLISAGNLRLIPDLLIQPSQ